MVLEQTASAEIVQFPLGGRAGYRALDKAQRPKNSDAVMPRDTALGSGESWYHAEAIEAARTATT